jgi:hypothetical protein
MRKSLTLLLALSAQLWAGGFYLITGRPDANKDPQAMNAALTVTAGGCMKPENATVTGTAVGIVDGQKRTIALKLTPLRQPGAYAVARQWPADGRWVLQFVATNDGHVTSALIVSNPDGIRFAGAKLAPRAPSATEVDSLLNDDSTLARK